jgi:hypothetical protein
MPKINATTCFYSDNGSRKVPEGFLTFLALLAALALTASQSWALQPASISEFMVPDSRIEFWPGESVAVSDEIVAAWQSCNAEGTEEACENLRAFADDGVLIAQFSFEYPLLFNTNTTRNDRHAAFTEIMRLADAGLPIAQAVAGQMLLGNTIREADPILALQYLRAANEAESSIAARFLSVAYEEGIGVDVSHEEEIRYLILAAERGHARAGYDLAIQYIRGEKVDQDLDAARTYLRRAAERGVFVAADGLCTNIYFQLDEEIEPLVDGDEAEMWCRRTAELQASPETAY